jgi:simple sugar transport system ATP-binding protein
VSENHPRIEARKVSKYFGHVIALKDISIDVRSGEVMCLLGDNGAGKSTLIKLVSGVFPPDEGTLVLEGKDVHFRSPRQALEAGIATVFQDLATIPLISITRNFFLGREPTIGRGPLKLFDKRTADRIAREEIRKIGIDIRDPEQPVGTLSGGERQSLAIARAVYFGAKVLILDEPTSALGVKEAAKVLRYIVQARERGLAVIFITHNPHHAFPVGDRFTVLNRGHSMGTLTKGDTSRHELETMMAGGEEFERLDEELERGLGHLEGREELEATQDEEAQGLKERVQEAKGYG